MEIWNYFFEPVVSGVAPRLLLAAQCLTRQWTRLRQFPPAFGRFSHISDVHVDSDPVFKPARQIAPEIWT